MVIPHDGHELVNICCHECVGMMKALPARPAIERTDLRYLVQRRVVPFAECVVHIAGFFQVVRNRFCRLRHDRVVAREAHRSECVAAKPDRVRIAAGHQRGA